METTFGGRNIVSFRKSNEDELQYFNDLSYFIYFFFFCILSPTGLLQGLQVLGVHYLAFIAKSMVSRSSI